MAERCADCGKEIERHKLGWANRESGELVFACRGTIEPDRRENAKVPYRYTAVDYHYVEGEEQRHSRAEAPDAR